MADGVVFSAGTDVDLEGTVRDVQILDRHIDNVFSLDSGLPETLVFPVLTVQDAASDGVAIRGNNVHLENVIQNISRALQA